MVIRRCHSDPRAGRRQDHNRKVAPEGPGGRIFIFPTGHFRTRLINSLPTSDPPPQPIFSVVAGRSGIAEKIPDRRRKRIVRHRPAGEKANRSAAVGIGADWFENPAGVMLAFPAPFRCMKRLLTTRMLSASARVGLGSPGIGAGWYKLGGRCPPERRSGLRGRRPRCLDCSRKRMLPMARAEAASQSEGWRFQEPS